jgi:hypothetical protein
VAHDAFISYSAHDKTVADAACAVLEARGIRCWVAPRDLTPGMDWGEGIIDAINGSRLMVLVYSASANESPQIKREVERAVHRGIPIIPFRIEDVPMSKALEYFISSPHWLDAFTPPLERHLDYLARTIALILARPGPDSEPVLHEAQPPSIPPAASSPSPPPAPSPPAVPVRPASRRSFVWGVAALVCAGVVWFFLRSGPVDRALVGAWTVTNTDKAGQWRSTFTIDRAGRYQMQVTVRDTGIVRAAQGRYEMHSTTQNIITGTYTPLNSATVAITSPAGTVNWTRRSGGAPGDAVSLDGVWDADPFMNGATWHQTISYGTGGAYGLVSTTGDAGAFTASDGHWKMVSQAGHMTEGTYQLMDPRTLSFVGPLGPSVWTRR